MTPMARLRVIAVLGLGLGLAAAGAAHAQSARASLSQNEVALNQQFVLNVDVSNARQLDADPVLPDVSGFAAFLGSGSSTSMQFVNGRTSLSITMQYRFQATTEGTFEIGPVAVQAGGRDLQTEPLTIRITASAAPAARTGRGGGRRRGEPIPSSNRTICSSRRPRARRGSTSTSRSSSSTGCSPGSTSTATTSRGNRPPPASGSKSWPTRGHRSNRWSATACSTSVR